MHLILINIRSLFADAFVSHLEIQGHKEQRHAMSKTLAKRKTKVKQKQRKQFSSLYTEP